MQIPVYPDSRALALDDKVLLDPLLGSLQPQVSELTFAGLYLFMSAHRYRLARIDESLIILGRGYDGREYFLPPLGGDISAALQVLFADGRELYGADDAFAVNYLTGEDLQVSEDRDSFDYVYLRDELASLPGNRFHKKKNRISYFSRRYDYRTEQYQDRHRDGCLVLLEEWRRSVVEADNPSLEAEVEATAMALKLSGELGLEGVVVLVADSVKAFSLGERLRNDTAVCHFEKADPFMEGLSQLVNREFSRMLFQDCRYINREQDLGDQGLRSAKLSYHPVEMIRKYRASRLVE
ncbi:DUF2156 domain-containing protein [Geobacter sp. SVR]|uniref:DUF2156 domain-containing protein n=1 Tax=Geobacter sp. SVR TaxID=2495594 RepID=UPI00143EFEBB|nr:phosphatidylglycerol lysyltransferase domain-containing protein [Geobacter sp. SVR]BCS53148.1 hypothetical protein GSVR_14560 [Geobacter sp. SVR]GCF84533.1 hypothetical protein GSbR_11330 [Geobacter sp. SVR]